MSTTSFILASYIIMINQRLRVVGILDGTGSRVWRGGLVVLLLSVRGVMVTAIYMLLRLLLRHECMNSNTSKEVDQQTPPLVE